MITGRMDCPRCGVPVTYSCDLKIGGVLERREDAVVIAVSTENFQCEHHCKTPIAA